MTSRFGRWLLSGAIAGATLVAAGSASAQSNPLFIPLQGGGTSALYKPDSGPAPHVIILQSHRVGQNLNSDTCKQFASRGFMALCFNTRYVNDEAGTRWDNVALDVKAAVDVARKQPGITKVVLFNHSGGTPMFTYYQALAENGISYCNGANKISPCANDLMKNQPWVPADAMVYADAHPGNGANLIRDLNPSLSFAANGDIKVDPALDPFSKANGFNPDGASHYSKEFRDRYYAAQSRVANQIIKDALAKQAAMKEGKHRFPDDDIVLIPGSDQAGQANLSMMDPSIPELMWTKQPRKLLKNDGSIVTEIVKSVSAPEPEMAKINRQFDSATRVYTTKSLLTAQANWSTNSLTGIDHCSSNAESMCATKSIKVPSLWMPMGAWHFIVDQEEMYETSPATDKDIIVIEGAVHGYTACKPCEKTPGQYSNSVKNMYDYAAKWINARF